MKILLDEYLKQNDIKTIYLQNIIDFLERSQKKSKKKIKKKRIIILWKNKRIIKALESIDSAMKLRTDLMGKKIRGLKIYEFFKKLQESERVELIALNLDRIFINISKFNKITFEKFERIGYTSYYEDLKLISDLILDEIKKKNIIILPKNPLLDLLSYMKKIPLFLNLLMPKNGLLSIIVTDKDNNIFTSWIFGRKNGIINLMTSIDTLEIEGFSDINFNWRRKQKREKYYRILEKKINQKVKVAIFTSERCVKGLFNRSQKGLSGILQFLKEQRQKGEFIIPRKLPKTALIFFGTMLLRIFAKDN